MDGTGNNFGEVDADTGQSGGIEGTSWIDIFTRGPITIVGKSSANDDFVVHATQALSNSKGGIVTIKSITDAVTASGHAVQAGGLGGGKGGFVTVQANLDVVLNDGELEARGSTTGRAPSGGTVNVRSFNGAIGANAASLIDVTGKNPPNGVVNLTACTTIGFPPGQVTPASIIPTKATGVCGGAPLLPLELVSGDGKSYVKLPPCVCGCACATGFTPLNAPAGAQLTIKGQGLKGASEVWFSTDCNIPSTDPGAIATMVAPPFISKTDSQIKVTVPGGLLGPQRIILVTPGGTCCSADVFTP